MIELTCSNPIMCDIYGRSKDMMMLMGELQLRYLDESLVLDN